MKWRGMDNKNSPEDHSFDGYLMEYLNWHRINWEIGDWNSSQTFYHKRWRALGDGL